MQQAASVRTGLRDPARVLGVDGCGQRGCAARRDSLPLHGVTLEYIPEGLPQLKNPPDAVLHLCKAVPARSNPADYLHFESLYTRAYSDYLTPGESRVFFRYHGKLIGSKVIRGVEWWENRVSEDDAEERTALGPGTVLVMSPRIARLDVPLTLAVPDKFESFRRSQADWYAMVADPLSVASLTPWPSHGKPQRTFPRRSHEEIELENLLIANEVDACPHARAIRAGSKVLHPDIVVPALGLVIEYDGGYFHSRAGDQRRDLVKTAALLDLGFRVIRIRDRGLDRLPARRPGLRQVQVQGSRSTGDPKRTVAAILATLHDAEWGS